MIILLPQSSCIWAVIGRYPLWFSIATSWWVVILKILPEVPKIKYPGDLQGPGASYEFGSVQRASAMHDFILFSMTLHAARGQPRPNATVQPTSPLTPIGFEIEQSDDHTPGPELTVPCNPLSFGKPVTCFPPQPGPLSLPTPWKGFLNGNNLIQYF